MNDPANDLVVLSLIGKARGMGAMMDGPKLLHIVSYSWVAPAYQLGQLCRALIYRRKAVTLARPHFLAVQAPESRIDGRFTIIDLSSRFLPNLIPRDAPFAKRQ